MLAKRHFELDVEFEEADKASINIKETDTFIDRLVRLNILPFKNHTMFFNDDLWDFSTFTNLNVHKSDMRFNFLLVEEEFRLEMKKYVLIKILENKVKIITIHGHFKNLKIYFNFLKNNHVYNINDVTVNVLKKFIASRSSNSFMTIRKYKYNIKNFYNYFATNYHDILTLEMTQVLEYKNINAYYAIKEQNKTQNITDEYFDKLISVLISVMDNPYEPVHIRSCACIIMLMSQTGLRVSEVLSLEIDALMTIQISGNRESNYLNYKTWKREKLENKYSIVRTFINELAKKAYVLLIELHSERRNKLQVPYLYMGNRKLQNSSAYPIDSRRFGRIQKDFFSFLDKYIPTLDLPSQETSTLKTVRIGATFKNPIIKSGIPAETITFPSTNQYRVHVCTELYNKGVPLKYIQKFMGHLSSEMQGYYVRPKTQTQENVEFSQKTLSDLVNGKLTLLGINPKDLTTKINEFIAENNFKIETNLDDIVTALMKKIPVRQKIGGVCIKASMLRECSIDAKTNEFYCAYGVCPNVFHFFYNIDISYRKVKELSESIKINSRNGFIKQVQKEKNMISTVISKQFEPEFKELKKEIVKRNIEDIFIEYPNIKHIVENINQIEQEVSKWKRLATE
jgi:integrase